MCLDIFFSTHVCPHDAKLRVWRITYQWLYDIESRLLDWYTALAVGTVLYPDQERKADGQGCAI